MQAAIGGDVDQAIVGAGPDAIDVGGRGRDRVDHALLRGLRGGLVAILADAGGDLPRLARQVGRDFLPTAAAIGGAKHGVGGEEHDVRIGQGEDHRSGAQRAVVRAADGLGRDVFHLAGAAVEARDLAAEDDVGVERIGDGVAILFDADRRPFAESELAVIAAAGDAGGAALLLAAAHAIGKIVVGVDVIHLRGGLVVPGTPGFAAIDR